MSHKSSKYTHRPFKDLKSLLKSRNISLTRNTMDRPPREPETPKPPTLSESDLFLKAMADVTPIVFNKTGQKTQRSRTLASPNGNGDDETLAALNILIRRGRGFIVSQTPEYMESDNPGVSAEILRRLHQGHYAIQDFIDLHGLRVHDAEHVFKGFIRRAIRDGLRTVLIVHGRGLTSPKEPVLKKNVFFWLTRGPLRKWVVAFTSARSCDGGAGATYVLLRRRPLTKSQRKKSGRLGTR